MTTFDAKASEEAMGMFEWRDRSGTIEIGVPEEQAPIDRSEEGVVEIASLSMDGQMELYFTEMDDLARKWLNWRRYQVVGPYPKEPLQEVEIGFDPDDIPLL